ncbi:POPLD-domain-containing protein [Coniochaeta ligniaria NRRL 30616]|uniref:POPLD-domain-containing protein n=1 Tax=Coniochaeta ligniaria NRRL 30616 TaxID=1408157 RepID=A0A1J7JUE3_9PEZI|nr:POPLD-domain-containing protein [Coniochaeta ligniaria NRRL 30616]
MNKQPPKGSEARKRKDPPTSGNTSSAQQSKHASPTGQQSNARSHKRAKLQDARTIRTQASDAALKDGELDLQAFLSAREFEIRALEASMRKSKAASTTRAFQKVPRDMRRRTASHNVKRVPKRLRARAAKEMAEDNTPTVDARKRRPRTTRARIRAETAKRLRLLADRKRKKRAKQAASNAEDQEGAADVDAATSRPTVHTRAARPKIRRNVPNEPPKPKSKFRKRQLDKTWLPTHLWHAKRARMTEPKDPLWRFAIPLTPNDKCYRPTHRASGDKGAVVWDMSYMSTIGLYGSTEGIGRVLVSLGLPQHLFTDKKHQRWRSGLRKQSGMLSKERKGVRKDIGPATIIWNPVSTPDDTAEGPSKAPRRQQRQVFLRVHPSCFFELFNELAVLVKAQTPQLYVEDLRFEIGSIELVGPGSTEALLSILHPYYGKAESEEQHAKIFKSLVGVTNPASLAPGALLAFSIMDPRLRHPPKRVQAGDEDVSALETLTRWPVAENIKPHGLFDRSTRFQAGVLPTQKSLDRRKGSGTPGMELGITARDSPIPIILFASRPASGGQAQGSWTLMAPWKCILPIWYNLVRVPLSSGGNPRLGGLNELRQVAFEQGVPWFPGDYLGTDAGAEWELEQRAKRRADWERRPKGKRVAWDSLDLGAGRKGEVGDGLACDVEHLFGLPKDEPLPKKGAEEEIVASGAEADQMEVDKPKDAETATGSKSKTENVQQLVSRQPLSQIHRISLSAFSALVDPEKRTTLPTPPAHLIVTVTLTFVGRGVAGPCARIYRLPTRNPIVVLPSTQAEVPATPSQPGDAVLSPLPTDLRDQWLSRLGGAKAGLQNGSRVHPPPQRIPAGADMATRKKLVAESILNPTGGPLPWPWESAQTKGNKTDIGGQHPLCPGEEDLVGFVTTGAFCLADGKGKAIGSLAVAKALEAMDFAKEKGRPSEGRLCVVRNAGESVGWLAKWEVV